MSLQLDLNPCADKLFTFSGNPGCLLSRLRRRFRRFTWKDEIFSYAGSKVEKFELDIIEKFVVSMAPKYRDWLLVFSLNGHRFEHRSKWWSCMNAEEEELAYATACHEAGHVLPYWFSRSPKHLVCVTIVPEKNTLGKVDFEETVDPRHVYTKDDVFSDMCCFIGGGIGKQMLAYGEINFGSLRYDIVIFAYMNYKLAKDIMLSIGETDPSVLETLMAFLLRKCFKVTTYILKSHLKELKAVSYALFAEKKLSYWDLIEIIGPRPDMAKTLFEEFVMDDISSGQFKEEEEIFEIRRFPPYGRRREMREIEEIEDRLMSESTEKLCIDLRELLKGFQEVDDSAPKDESDVSRKDIEKDKE